MKETSRVHTALIELIIVILFFSISAAVILQFFVSAHLKSEDSAQKSAAVLQAQQIAETFQQTGSPPSGAVSQGDGAMLYFDEDWNPLQSAKGASFFAELRFSQDKTDAGSLRKLTVNLLKNDEKGGEAIYALSVQKYVPGA